VLLRLSQSNYLRVRTNTSGMTRLSRPIDSATGAGAWTGAVWVGGGGVTVGCGGGGCTFGCSGAISAS